MRSNRTIISPVTVNAAAPVAEPTSTALADGLVASNAPSLTAPPAELEAAVGAPVEMRDPAAPNTLQETQGPVQAGGLEIVKQDDGSVLIRRVAEHDDSTEASLGLRGIKLKGNAAAFIPDPRVTIFVMYSGAPPPAEVPTLTMDDVERAAAPARAPDALSEQGETQAGDQ